MRVTMPERNTRIRIFIIFFLIGIIACSDYLTDTGERKFHVLYQGLFFFPVMLSGYWFGLRGGLAAAMSIALALIPLSIIHWKGFSSEDFNNIIAMVLYNVVGVTLGVLRDREQRQQKHLREAESLAAMGRAVSSLAHDMKTPLIAIGGFTNWVKKHTEADSPCQEKLNIVIGETMRLENMVKDMLDFSRPLELHPSEEDLGSILTECLTVIEGMAEERKVSIRIESPENIPSAILDAMKMKQVLINLIMNAVQASPEGESVIVSSHRTDKELIIDVSDRGCGIPVDKIESIFIPFFTTKREGTGLGLSTARKIVEAHGGHMEIVNNSENGITFRIVIPIASR
jgi:two-component system, NtrC family, sensor histidine kinase HydH